MKQLIMEILIDNISKNRKLNHVILTMPSTPKSYSASLLLREYYRDLDVSFSQENDWRYLFIVRRYFLRKVKKNGHWTCHYCGKPVYKMSQRNKKRQSVKDCITIDHMNPASQIEDTLDTKNFVECCFKCNIEKSDMPYHEFKAKKRKLIAEKQKKLSLELV